MNAKSQNMVRVRIFGHEYSVRAVADSNYIEEVAAYVDQRMRETEMNMSEPQSTSRIAILAALSITDELVTLKRKRNIALQKLEHKATAIADYLDEVLDTNFKE